MVTESAAYLGCTETRSLRPPVPSGPEEVCWGFRDRVCLGRLVMFHGCSISLFFSEQATTGVRKLVQIYNICASVSACVSVKDPCYNFPQGNLAMKPTYQDCKTHMKPKKPKQARLQDQKNKKKQDCKTHKSSNLGTLGFDIFFLFFCFLGFPCLGQQYHPKMHKKYHCAPGLSSIWCLMDWASQQKTVETTHE